MMSSRSQDHLALSDKILFDLTKRISGFLMQTLLKKENHSVGAALVAITTQLGSKVLRDFVILERECFVLN